jgi:hypothetical protein
VGHAISPTRVAPHLVAPSGRSGAELRDPASALLGALRPNVPFPAKLYVCA